MSSPYKFRFYRCVTNDVGQRFNSTVEVVEISRAKSMERAHQAAIRRFTRHQHVSHWDCLATGYEMIDPKDQAPARMH
jgi:hypothetical protein